LLNDIRILAVEAFYSVPRGGVEIGGVFFGAREADAIHIQAQRPIRCQYATGPSFTLSVDDQLGLSGLLEKAPADPDLAGMTPLGWYHSHTRSELFLSPSDLQLYSDFFHERWQIAMVLRPANLQATKAGIFFRERSGTLKSDAPLQEFRLEPPTFGLTLLDSQDAAKVAKQAPVVPVPPVAAAVQPSAPATVVAPPPPPAISPAEPPAVALRAAAAAPSAAIAAVPPPVAVVAAAAGNGAVGMVAEAPAARIPEVAPARSAEPKLEKLVEPGLHSFNVAEAEARKRRRIGWMWVFAIFMLLVAAGGAVAFVKWERVGKVEGLGLETYDMKGVFLIRWDRESRVIRSATHATLEIDDGGEKIPIELSPAELGSGGYPFTRRSAEVSVRMKVDGTPPVEEFLNFKGEPGQEAEPAQTPEDSNALTQALREKENLKTELINESMKSSELRREITALKRQLAEARAKSPSEPAR
jgi:proteasome lid subunit RPN8/RPN11